MKTYADITARARELHAAGAAPTREWTLPIMCDHLAKAMTGSTGVLGPGAARRPASIFRRWIGRLVVLKLGIVPKGVKSPERVLPDLQISWDDAINKLDAAVRLCEQRAGDGQPWLLHPLLGFSDAPTWLRFHLVHARHHFGCLRLPARSGTSS